MTGDDMSTADGDGDPRNNGKEARRWGVAEIQKMSPSTTGRCSRHAAAVLSNTTWQHGSQSHGLVILAVRVWLAVVYFLSRRGRTCKI